MFSFLKYRRSFHAMQRLYNRIYRFYGRIEKSLGPSIETVVQTKIAAIPGVSACTALEYACGSGLLSLKLAPLFQSITGRDVSVGMLERARMRAKAAGLTIDFREGNILAIDEAEKSYDYAFISFALHLFPIETEKQILKKLCAIARRAVIIIDHSRKWQFGAAIVEWLEGSHYDLFIKQDFRPIAQEIGCRSFEEVEIEECRVMSFLM